MSRAARPFVPEGPFRLDRLGELAAAALRDPSHGDHLIADVGPVDEAGPGDIVCLGDAQYIAALLHHRPAACIAKASLADLLDPDLPVLISRDPRKSFALIAQAFHPQPKPVAGLAAGAHIDPTAVIGAGCEIAPGAVIGANVTLGERVTIGANAVIGTGCVIGDACIIGPLASVHYAVIGRQTVILAGARIGEAGFGFVPNPPHGHIRLPQLGRVVIGERCEIGANSAIDRGAFADTVIGDGSIIDNLVQIGHNVRLGRGCVVAGQAGISGSVVLGDFAALGGQAGIADHLEIGSGGRVAAGAGVMRNVPPGGTVAGLPAMPMRDHMRQVATLARLSAKKGKIE